VLSDPREPGVVLPDRPPDARSPRMLALCEELAAGNRAAALKKLRLSGSSRPCQLVTEPRLRLVTGMRSPRTLWTTEETWYRQNVITGVVMVTVGIVWLAVVAAR
jgi:hypothetical protein